ncbi:MAG: AsmA-like C-terminal region-containing protein [Chthoniobacteraceae bacterium]
MKRLSKVILISLAALLLLSVLGLVVLRAYVQGEGGRAQLEQALGKALKLPVNFQSVVIHWPSKLRVEGITTPDGDGAGQPTIKASALEGTLALRPLLSGEFVVRDITLEQPTFDWPQDAEGRWTWPSPEKPTTEKPLTEEASKPKDKSQSRKASVLVQGVKVVRGNVVLSNSRREPVITATDVTLDFARIDAGQIAGTVAAAQLVWGGRYAFEGFRTNLSYGNDTLLLDELTATSFGGAIHGRYEMDTRADGQPFKARVEVRSVNLDALAGVGGWGDGEVAGRLSGEADVTGRTDQIARLEGPGHVRIEGGHFKQLEVFESIAQLLDLGELANFQPRETRADFTLRDEKVFIDPLVLTTENLRIAASGVSRFDGKLALDARLSVSERVAKTLPEIAVGSFTKLEDGQYGLDFKISGKNDKPKTDLPEKLIGKNVKGKLQDLIGNFFGGAPKEDKKKDEAKPDPDRQ